VKEIAYLLALSIGYTKFCGYFIKLTTTALIRFERPTLAISVVKNVDQHMSQIGLDKEYLLFSWRLNLICRTDFALPSGPVSRYHNRHSIIGQVNDASRAVE
jgi:hypothetical protein